MLNKKAISPIIASTLLIVVSVIIIVVVLTFGTNFTKKGTTQVDNVFGNYKETVDISLFPRNYANGKLTFRNSSNQNIVVLGYKIFDENTSAGAQDLILLEESILVNNGGQSTIEFSRLPVGSKFSVQLYLENEVYVTLKNISIFPPNNPEETDPPIDPPEETCLFDNFDPQLFLTNWDFSKLNKGVVGNSYNSTTDCKLIAGEEGTYLAVVDYGHFSGNEILNCSNDSTLNIDDSFSIEMILNLNYTPTEITKMAIGKEHSCFLLDSKSVECFGNNAYGQLGDGKEASRLHPRPIEAKVPELENIIDIGAGDNFSCALTGDGNIYCWGIGESGRLGIGSEETALSPKKIIEGDKDINFVKLSVGGRHACAVSDYKGIKSLYCWGANDYGQLGVGSEDRFIPQIVLVDLKGIVATDLNVVSGYNHNCLNLINDNKEKEFFCWGDNSMGQVGINSLEPKFNGLQSHNNNKVVDVFSSSLSNHTCYLFDDKRLNCWGNNNFGQIGVNDLNVGGNIYSPREVITDQKLLSIGVGSDHTCGINLKNELYCWGSNDFGQLTPGRHGSQQVIPVIMAGFVDINAVYLGSNSSCVKRDNGKEKNVSCWGENNSGKLGFGCMDSRPIPETKVIYSNILNKLGEYALFLNNDNSLSFLVSNDPSTCSERITTDPLLSEDQLIIFSYNHGSGKLYLNGGVYETNPTLNSSPISDLLFGENYKGLLKSAKIYDYSFTDENITNILNYCNND